MAKYTGSWAKGFASTFDPISGINLGLQWKEKKAKQKKIDDEIEQLKISAMGLAAKFDRARADGTITQQEFGDAMAWAVPLGKEISGRTETLYKNYQDMTPDQLQTELDNIEAVLDFSKELDFTNIEQMKAFGNKLTQPNAKMQWDLIIKSIEEREKPMQAEVFPSFEAGRAKYPTAEIKYSADAGGYVVGAGEVKPPGAPKAPGITDYNSAANYLSKFKDSPPDTFDRIKTGFQSQFPNIDMSSITQESLREPEKPTPEGEVTAGEKRTYDMASSVLFGSSDFVTGISKPGIISSRISSKLNMGQPLNEEEKTEVRNNYNLIKGTLPSEIISSVEAQLQRYGITLEAPEPGPAVTPEAEPKKWWEFWKGETTPTTPEVTPKVGEIPTPKVPTGGKEALIPTMSNKELYDALKGLDPSDPMYKSLYDEAVERGLIAK